MGKNTGTLTFGSMASPLMNNGQTSSGYIFSHIEFSYETYKEIKEVIESKKD